MNDSTARLPVTGDRVPHQHILHEFGGDPLVAAQTHERVDHQGGCFGRFNFRAYVVNGLNASGFTASGIREGGGRVRG